MGNGVPAHEFEALVTFVRQQVGPTAILYANEGWGNICATCCNDACMKPAGGVSGTCCTLKSIPKELDLISEDIYTYPGECSCGGQPCDPDPRNCSWNATAEMAWARHELERNVFPLMHPHQKAFIVAGTFGCTNFSLVDFDTQQDTLVGKLRAHAEWAEQEPRIAGLNPYSARLLPPPVVYVTD